MQTHLNILKNQISDFKPVTACTNQQYQDFVNNCTVILLAGGESSRFKEVAGSSVVNKNAYALPNNDTMIEMCIRMYKQAGFTNFAALLFHKSESIEALLGDGSKFGVNITYSYDPGPVGKGGAIRHAIENGSVKKGHYFIIHNPDDVILDFNLQGCSSQNSPQYIAATNSFPAHIVNYHLAGVAQGCLGTVVTVPQYPYDFTGMQVQNNFITEIETYPMIPIPTHIGVTVFSYQVTNYFSELIDYSQKTDFEKIIFPFLSKNKQLYSVDIPTDCWIAVNNAKAYSTLIKRLKLN